MHIIYILAGFFRQSKYKRYHQIFWYEDQGQSLWEKTIWFRKIAFMQRPWCIFPRKKCCEIAKFETDCALIEFICSNFVLKLDFGFDKGGKVFNVYFSFVCSIDVMNDFSNSFGRDFSTEAFVKYIQIIRSYTSKIKVMNLKYYSVILHTSIKF